MKSYDLSTSSKWANLADGEHTVTIKSKASNYGTSNFSNSVTVMKGSASYTLEAGTYKWVDRPDFGMMESSQTMLFMSNGIDYNSIYVNTYDNTRHLLYYKANGSYITVYAKGKYFPDNTQTITLTTAQTVSADFYNWAITGGNLVKQEGETWVLNEICYSPAVPFGTVQISFVSENASFTSITWKGDGDTTDGLYYGDVYVYLLDDETWRGDGWRTITFSTTPSGDLLTWLQANGTKQGVTEHTLTSNTIASSNISVNGSSLSTLPYILSNGDAIVITLTGMEDSAISLNGVTRSNNDTVTINDTDIAIELVGGNYNDPKLTINYTA